MSETRIICETCGTPVAWCSCPGVGVHPNSAEAYYKELDEFGVRCRSVYDWVSRRPAPVTDRQVRDGLFGTTADMNAVRPRINELIKSKWLIEVGSTKDKTTNRTVRLVRARTPEQRKAKDLQQGELL